PRFANKPRAADKICWRRSAFGTGARRSAFAFASDGARTNVSARAFFAARGRDLGALGIEATKLLFSGMRAQPAPKSRPPNKSPAIRSVNARGRPETDTCVTGNIYAPRLLPERVSVLTDGRVTRPIFPRGDEGQRMSDLVIGM